MNSWPDDFRAKFYPLVNALYDGLIQVENPITRKNLTNHCINMLQEKLEQMEE